MKAKQNKQILNGKVAHLINLNWIGIKKYGA